MAARRFIALGVNKLVLPDYKHVRGSIRKISDATGQTRPISLKAREAVP